LASYCGWFTAGCAALDGGCVTVAVAGLAVAVVVVVGEDEVAVVVGEDEDFIAPSGTPIPVSFFHFSASCASLRVMLSDRCFHSFQLRRFGSVVVVADEDEVVVAADDEVVVVLVVADEVVVVGEDEVVVVGEDEVVVVVGEDDE